MAGPIFPIKPAISPQDLLTHTGITADVWLDLVGTGTTESDFTFPASGKSAANLGLTWSTSNDFSQPCVKMVKGDWSLKAAPCDEKNLFICQKNGKFHQISLLC